MAHRAGNTRTHTHTVWHSSHSWIITWGYTPKLLLGRILLKSVTPGNNRKHRKVERSWINKKAYCNHRRNQTYYNNKTVWCCVHTKRGVIRVLEGAWLISVALLCGNSFCHPGRNNHYFSHTAEHIRVGRIFLEANEAIFFCFTQFTSFALTGENVLQCIDFKWDLHVNAAWHL